METSQCPRSCLELLSPALVQISQCVAEGFGCKHTQMWLCLPKSLPHRVIPLFLFLGMALCGSRVAVLTWLCRVPRNWHFRRDADPTRALLSDVLQEAWAGGQ